MPRNFNPAAPFARWAKESPGRPALWVDGAMCTYGDLAEEASRIAGWLCSRITSAGGRVGILSSRSRAAYAGILAACWAGAGYVPLNTGFPVARLRKILELAGVDAVLVDSSSLSLLGELMDDVPEGRFLIVDGPSTEIGGLRVDGEEMLESVTGIDLPVAVSSDAEAYLVFTSGSTGEPRAVSVSTGNLAHGIESLLGRHQLGPNDRFSQFFELSFDFVVMDIFTAWQVGGSTFVIPTGQKMGPGRFIREHALTVWTCVPSDIAFMRRMKMLKPGIFPSLRHSFFSGEVLTEEMARAWQEASPNCRIVNLYGQSEAPIGSTTQVFGCDSKVTIENGSVAIGTRLDGVHVAVVGEEGDFLSPPSRGEIAVSGAHVTLGYPNDREQTERKYRVLEHPVLGRSRWYMTGDTGREDADGTFHFLGRIDNEVRIAGHRVMLEEIEHFLKICLPGVPAAVVPWPFIDGFAQGVAAVLHATDMDAMALRDQMRRLVPPYMVPKKFLRIDEMPRTSSGKIDRKAIASLLE